MHARSFHMCVYGVNMYALVYGRVGCDKLHVLFLLKVCTHIDELCPISCSIHCSAHVEVAYLCTHGVWSYP